MASRIKEDERNEKIIRGLLKLSANRRCINCNNLGPQYVCTNFWTFICTNCSGLHREFCHRVKSISMAKFTTQEVNALQEGGNERAKEIYFKEWDPQRHSLPDSSNIDSLRDFIKHVYVNRRFTGERNTERPPLGKADRTDSSERRVDSYGGDSRSPSYDDRYNDRLGTGGRNGDRNIRFIYGGRSPGYDQGDNKRSPRKIEVVDDRIRDDRYGIRRFEDRRLPDVVAKPEGSSPSRKKDVPSPPEVRPVRDILGDDMPQLRVGDTHKSKNTGVPASSSPAQTTSTSSVGSTDRNSVQSKTVNLGSLIDFTAEPEPSVTAAVPHQPTPQQITSPHSNGGDWASFDNVGQQKDSQTPANVGTLESALAQLSTSGPVPTPHMVATLPTVGIVATPRTNDVGQWPTTQQHQASIFPADLRQTTNLALNTTTAAGQSLGSSAVPTAQGPLPNSGRPFPQITGKPHQEMSTVVSPQPASVEAKSTGRKEIPADLFTVLYPSAHVAVSGWQRGPHPGIGYGMQYPMAMPQAIPSFPNSSKSTNPFDLGSEPVLSHAPMVPSMTSLQGLPHVTGPSPIVRSSSFGNPSPQWVPQPQSSMTSLQGLPHVTGPSPMVRSSSFENPSPQWVPQPHSSMTSLQGLPHVTGPSPLVRSSSFENPSSQWVPQPQSSFPNHSHPSPQWVPQPQSSFPPAMPQGPYMMQQVPGNMPQQQQFPVNTPQQQQLPGSMPQMLHNNMLMMGRQGTGGHGAAPPGNLGMDQLQTRRYPPPNTPSSFDSTGGNPFV